MKNGSVEEIVECLGNGGVVLLPTDTVYGLAVSPNFDKSIDRLFALKRRPRNVNLPIMVWSDEELESLGFEITQSARRLLRSPLIPGSLTLALGFRGDDRPAWLEGRDEAAVRIPNDERLLAVLREAGPLLVTSANAHSAGTPDNVAEILEQLDGAPDLYVDGGILKTTASTLVNCRVDPPVIERVGVVPESEVFKYL
ncbi:MAG TPA: L-threonylcarbamoyladenylate synthase [Pyrinomonadaceae bacterium]|jgi:L-threonylcarbamoyladenylate synthase|nr:L-threonylcarbamoyladenylate synthase [Pyrinomonadaceae bacterium]